ncbi:MAG: hypothetical protein ISR90_00865 [Candidatus Marinimicrobia bacterium]|nr:hypothetical protein [Candidatus Neomarinimicrobiota bacterium]MBL7022595.1 hypothetical protein [Candidatus Neomarinimicrobiota bacterium]MBL7109870.1 hypothetical protein [Candidatus Neomarinimicrobiota bacterium]
MVYFAEMSNWGIILLIWWLVSMFLGKKKKKLQKTGDAESSPPAESDPFDLFKTIRENLPVSESFGKTAEIVKEEIIRNEIPKVGVAQQPISSEDDLDNPQSKEQDLDEYKPKIKVNSYRKLLKKNDDVRTAIILKEILDKPKARRSR